MTRQTKTPRQRAEEALGVAERRHRKAIATRNRLKGELAAAETEAEEANQLRAYAKQHPALATPAATTPKETTTP